MDAPASPTPRAYLHVGAPKTGSTFLQGVLWRNRDSLLEHGVHMLGDDQGQHYRAGHDLRGLVFNPADPGVDWTGAWDRMASRAALSESAAVVVSDEHLASLTAEQATRAVRSLEPREVHVVYVTRDLPGLLPSEWQEFVKHGSTLTYPAWAEKVLADPQDGPGRWFWSVHDVESVVARWSAAVPRERIHLITMPPRSAPRDEIWVRFTTVLGCPPSAATDLEAAANPSLGLASAEVLRRVNAQLSPALPKWHRTGIVRDVLANEVLNPVAPGGRPGLPPALADVVLQRAGRTSAAVTTLGCDLVGDPTDLLPSPEPVGDSAAPDDAAVAEVATAALARLVDELAGMSDRLHAERRERSEAEQQARHDYEAGLRRALEEHEAWIWSQHPIAHRIQAGKQRLVAAESTNRAVAAALGGYRAVRDRLEGSQR